MNKRLLQFLIFLSAPFVATAQEASAAERPNILFCVADDWSYGHASIYGDNVVKTPNFDRIAREGALFHQAYCASPSCTPSRGAMLTGRPVHQLEEGASLWSALPAKFKVYPNLLEASGYAVGLEGKGWAPGDFYAGGWSRNPAGPQFKNFETFLASVPKDKPFCFWYGSHDPHRPYEAGSGVRSGMNPKDVQVPPIWPDSPEVRSDICDYYIRVQRFDKRIGELLKALEDSGRLEDTMIVVTSDNGMPFPRGTANLYDQGTRMPLAIRWPGHAQPGAQFSAFVAQTDFAPTFLEAGGVTVPPEMAGKSLLPVLAGKPTDDRTEVFTERERHANVRKGDLSYPSRAIRTEKWLYIRNLRPDRWPAGDPEMYFRVGEFGDIDPGPTKDFIATLQNDPQRANFYRLSMGKRAAEELYDVEKDPYQLHNLADNTDYAKPQKELRARLDRWMKETDDPRATHDDDRWDKFPYYGPGGR
jgi:N-sulfoglucosamine sulfohydrolase